MCVFTYTWIEIYQGLTIFISEDGKWEFQENKIEQDKRYYVSTLPEFFENIYSCIVYIKVFLKNQIKLYLKCKKRIAIYVCLIFLMF